MKMSTLKWALGAVSAISLGMGTEACSSSSSTQVQSSASSTSAHGGSSSVTASGSSTVSTSGSTVGGGSSVSTSSEKSGCYAPPDDKVFAEDGGSFYCPFSSNDAGKTEYCTPGTEHCCEPASGTATCSPVATACATDDTDWHCEGTPDCAGTSGTICCGTGTLELQGAQPGCAADGGTVAPYEFADKFTGSACVAASACTGSSAFQICSKTSECPAGDVCTPIKPKGNNIGYCSGSGTGAGSTSASGSGSSSASGSGSSSVSASSSSSSAG